MKSNNEEPGPKKPIALVQSKIRLNNVSSSFFLKGLVENMNQSHTIACFPKSYHLIL